MTTLPRGFSAGAVAAQIKKNGKPDVALFISDRDAAAAAVFTTNKVAAAPVLRDREIMKTHAGRMRAVLINAGCANACTGDDGLRNAQDSANAVATELHLSDSSQVFTMSTGVIGAQLPMEKLRVGIYGAAKALSEDGLDAAAAAIMTTDVVPKVVRIEKQGWSLSGTAKGSGMIHPNMATMLSVVVTDAVVSPARLRLCLQAAARRSFNRITVDGDTSTNDTLLVLANGASGVKPSREEFEEALTEACINLAKQVARDGEGATKFITIRITSAISEKQAEVVGRTIATSPLVKTAFYGEDANWGRIVCAAGYSGEDVDPAKMSLWFGGVHVFAYGTPTQYDDAEATRAMAPKDVEVHLDLGLGEAHATVWTCDMSHEYVTINGKYRT
ncbi:MAG: bifunctional glutamate N-acetyltransferase/amino-acid acetyltransferase ArgJ [Chloroflexi bacterium]|nr:bifunctional glutamate N-acetyltransferase/amino-acid acetyltransferase ArgJ [Chloroflexota bacterium]